MALQSVRGELRICNDIKQSILQNSELALELIKLGRLRLAI